MFLARTDEQKRFKLSIEELLGGSAENEPSPVMLVHGSGGIGKSELCRRFAEIGRGEVAGAERNAGRFVVAKVDWQDERDHHSSDYPALTGPQLHVVLTALYDTVASNPDFEDRQRRRQLERAFDPYLRVAAHLSGIREATEQAEGTDVFEPVLAASAQAAGAALGVPVPSEALGGIVSGVRAMRRRERVDPDEIALTQRPYELLMREFARGLRELSESKPILLVLDTYELITSCGGWIRQVMSQTGGRVLWVLAGRFENEEDAGHSGEIASFRRELPEHQLVVMRISPFDRETILELLSARGVSKLDGQTVDAIASLTHGVPLAVDIVSSLLGKETMEEISRAVTSDGDPSKVVRELTERYLRHAEKDPELQPDIPLLFGLALLYVDRTDLDLVGALWGSEADVGATLSELAGRHDFVLTGRRRLHQEVRETFQRYLLNDVERAEYRPSNRRATGLWLARSESAAAAGGSAEELLDSKEWRDALAAVIWHRFWVDNADGLELLCEVFPEAVLLRRSFAHELVGIASFFSETFSPEQSSLLRGLASLLSFGTFLDGWFAKRREAFQPDRGGAFGGESDDRDRENAFQVLRRRVEDASGSRSPSRAAAVELVIAKASASTNPEAALAALERAVELVGTEEPYLHREIELIGRGLANRLANPPSGREPSLAAVRAAELGSNYKEEKSPQDWLALAEVHESVGEDEEAARRFGEIVSRFGGEEGADIERVVSRGMFARAVVLKRLGRPEDAIRAYEELFERFGESEDPDLRHRTVAGLINQANLLRERGDPEAAIATLRRVPADPGENAGLALRSATGRARFNLAARLKEAGQAEEAMSVLDDLVERYGDDDEMKSSVVKALLDKASLLMAAEDLEAAIEAIDRVLARAGGEEEEEEEEEEEIRLGAVVALYNKASALTELDRPEEALEACDEAGKLAESLTDPELLTEVGEGLVNKGLALAKLGKQGEEMAAYDEVLARFESGADPPIRRVASRALSVKGARLVEFGSREEALAVFGTLEERFGQDEDPEVRVNVMLGAFNEAIALGALGRHEEEVDRYDRVLELCDADAAQAALLTSVMGSKGEALNNLGRTAEAIVLWDDLLGRLESPAGREGLTDGAVETTVVKALLCKGGSLEDAGRIEEALVAFDEIGRRFSSAVGDEMRRYIGEGRLKAAVALGVIGRREEAIVRYDEILEWGDREKDRDLVATVLGNKLVIQDQLDLAEEQFATAGEIIERFGEAEAPGLRSKVAQALFTRAYLFGDDGEFEAASAEYQQLANRYAGDEDPKMRLLVLKALSNQSVCLGKLDRTEDRLAVYERVVELAGDGELKEEERSLVVNIVLHKAALESEQGDPEALERAEADFKRAVRGSGESAGALGAYALFLLDRRKDRAGAREHFERAFAADPEAAGQVGNFARLLFEDGERERAEAMADRALAHATDAEDPLRLEQHFYLAALGPPERRADAFAAAQQLLDDGVRSPCWDLSAILARAAAESSPRMGELEAMAKRISEE